MEQLSAFEIVLGILGRFNLVWIAIAIVMPVSYVFRHRLGLYGKLYGGALGWIGLFICFFWLFTAIFAAEIALHPALKQFAIQRFAKPGVLESQSGAPFYFGADRFGRDVFSRVVWGSQIVLTIAPAATVVAFIVGISLGLPAGYFGGATDRVLSFTANLVLAFPVIVLFYLLVTPGIRELKVIDYAWIKMSIPELAAFVFAGLCAAFLLTMLVTRYRRRPNVLLPLLTVTSVFCAWFITGVAFDFDALTLLGAAPVLDLEPNELNIFIAVVFVSSPGVFRIVRGLTLDIRTRDYVAAAQTRGEGSWYVMLWEILPNARGPLIVDACLRVGYTTILLGALGYFGLGLIPESPDWGTTIKEGSALLRRAAHPAVPPALALMSFVLGLNLLADALREESLKD
ncbi:MAG: ABC transporter permease [Neomegalonema sp.]|nr:ABC transporter permease [Neomegalonema sp.]